jgi:FMN phosphatase YigB (HAD superfamily)
MDTKLVIFDLDDTLIKRWTDQFLPGVEEKLRDIGRMQEKPHIAIASNAGYVGMRYWREKVRADGGDIGDPNQSPPKEIFDENLSHVCDSIGEWSRSIVRVFRCFRYQAKSGNWGPVPEGEEDNPEWSKWWRKPEPGMLFQAMQIIKAYPGETVFVGDQEKDKEAAERAGCRFHWAWEYFGRPEPENEEEKPVQGTIFS